MTVNNQQVAHLWANQARASARGSNFYFDGPALFSYGGHFCAGRIINNRKGKRAYLLNAESYSNSTSRHQSYARRAIPSGYPIFYVPGASPRHEDNRQRFRDIAAAALKRIPERRNCDRMESDIRDAQRAVDSYNEYSAFFSLRGRLKRPVMSADDAARSRRYRATKEAREARERAKWEAEAEAPARAAAEAARLQEAAERDAKARDDFRAGGPRRYYIGGPCMLRLNGDTFETSQGADVPRADGVAMLALLARLVSGKQTLSARDNYTAGGFTLRGIEGDVVVIGCHRIPLTECAAMAALVGVDWPA